MLKQACFEHPLSAITMTLPAFAAQCWRLQNTICSTAVAVRQYLLPAWCSAANPPAAVAAVDQWDIQTDGHPTVTYTLLRILCRQHQQLDPENTGHQSKVSTPFVLPVGSTPPPQMPPDDDGANGLALICSGVSGCIGEFGGTAFDVWSQ